MRGEKGSHTWDVNYVHIVYTASGFRKVGRDGMTQKSLTAKVSFELGKGKIQNGEYKGKGWWRRPLDRWWVGASESEEFVVAPRQKSLQLREGSCL